MPELHRTVAPFLVAALWGCASLGGCGGAAAPAPAAAPRPAALGQVEKGTPPEVDISLARAKGLARTFTWLPYSKEAFDRAARENKTILLDGAAAWCHWCHVMDETTYKDPAINKLLAEKFIAIRVDVEEHPDIAERYGDWGWPATILMTAKGEELGKLRGYVPADELLETLAKVSSGKSDLASGPPKRKAADRVPDAAEAPWAMAYAVFAFDAYYDSDLGGWGRRQKSPLGENLEVEARRALRGDAESKRRVLQTAAGQRSLLDPVWGGVYQYSTGGKWTAPHFEKLMPYQAANLAAYAAAFRATGDAAIRKDAEGVASYLTKFLAAPDGAFYVSQDADVGSHEEGAAFVDGHVFYALDDAGRRRLGMPRIDKNVYAFENGLAIAAFVAFHEATGDAAALAQAKRAADLLLKTHVSADGRVEHDPAHPREVMFLADAASFGFALAELARVTGDAGYRKAAISIAAAMVRDFASSDGLLYSNTHDPGAVGVFAERRKPLDPNVLAARLLGAVTKLTGDESHKARAVAIVLGLSTPSSLEEQGRMVGTLLLAADDLGMLEGAL